MTEPPTVVNPEAVGDPNQTPVVRLWPASVEPDLRAMAAQAASREATTFGQRLHELRFLIADAVLAAVLPAHRAQVLDEAADALAAGGECDCAERDKNRAKPEGERVHAAVCSFWPDEDAADAVRRLAATGLTTHPVATVPAQGEPVVPRGGRP